MRLVPVVGGAGVDLKRHVQRDCRIGRTLHHALDDRESALDFVCRHLEDQLVVDLQQHLSAKLIFLKLRLDADHGAADDVSRGALQPGIDGRTFVE